MKKIVELEFKPTGQTKQYYTFELNLPGKPPQIFPKKIYLRKDFFEKEVQTIRMIINEKGD